MISLLPTLTVARRRVLLVAGVLAWCASLVAVWLEPASHVMGPKKTTPSDLDLHAALIRHMRAGEPYYAALGRELRERGFPTQSAFNWRLPQPLWLIARLPSPAWGRGILSALAVVLLAWSAEILLREAGIRGAILGLIGLAGAVLPCFLGDLYLSHLLWSTVLIGLSLCAEERRWYGLAIGLGVLAAVCRELAVGYCLVAAVLALRDGRRWIAAGWGLGLAVIVTMLAAHVVAVRNTGLADDVSMNTHMWWNPKSPYFWVRCTQVQGFLLLLPGWVSYLYLSAAVSGLVACRSRWGQLALGTVGGYLAAFLVVGQDVNEYWGTLLTVPLALGLSFLPQAAGDVVRWSGYGVREA